MYFLFSLINYLVKNHLILTYFFFSIVLIRENPTLHARDQMLNYEIFYRVLWHVEVRKKHL